MTLRLRRTSPDAARTSAASWVCCPTVVARVDGLIVTLETARGFTFTRMKDALPSTLNRTSASPSAIPVTPPPLESVAICGAEELHSTRCSARSTALPSLSMARYGSLTAWLNPQGERIRIESHETNARTNRQTRRVARAAACDADERSARPEREDHTARRHDCDRRVGAAPHWCGDHLVGPSSRDDRAQAQRLIDDERIRASRERHLPRTRRD